MILKTRDFTGETAGKLLEGVSGNVGEWLTLSSNRKRFEVLIAPKQAGETNQQFGDRVIERLLWAYAKMYFKGMADDQYSQLIQGVVRPPEAIPDEPTA